MKLKCPCGAKAESSNNNFGLAEKETNFAAALQEDATIAWFCPECKEKMRPHVKALYELSGKNDWLHWAGILRGVLGENYEN